MTRNYQLYIADIRQCCEKIIAFTDGMNQSQLVADERTCDAVLRNFGIIGVAANNIPDDVLRQMEQVDWQQIRGIRSVITPVDFRVDFNIVWKAIRQCVPALLTTIRDYQHRLGTASNQ